MTAKLYVPFVADMIAVVLMIVQLVGLNKLPGEKDSVKDYYRCFSGLVLVMCVLSLLKSYADLQMGVITPEDFGKLSESEEAVWYCTQVVSKIADIFLDTLLLYMWISFLCWFLFEDRDFIRRRFWVGFAPLVISGVLSGVAVPFAVVWEKGYWLFAAVMSVAYVVRIFYVLISLWLLREYKMQNGYLRFFNTWVFFIPVAVGWVLEDCFGWGVSTLGTALGLVLLYFSIVEEERYRDPATGFYSMKFAGYLQGLVERNKYAPLSVMTFTVDAPEDMEGFAAILKKLLPMDCEPIVCNDKKIAVLTNVGERGPLFMVFEDVKAAAQVKTDCVLKKRSETTAEFMERVL